MDNLENEHGTIRPAQSDELDLDEIVNEFKDYSPEQEQAAEPTAGMSVPANRVTWMPSLSRVKASRRRVRASRTAP